MKVEVEDVSAIEKKVKVEVPAEQVHDEFELAYEEVQKEVRIKGFRKGKSPRKILELHFSDYVKERVLKKLLEETLGPALDRKQLKPVIEPGVSFGELKPGQAFSYTLTVELKPAVELKEYKGLELARELYQVTEKTVEHEIDELREKSAAYEELKEPRPARDGDLLLIDLKAELEGRPVPSAGGENLQYPMGRDIYIPGFAGELAGIKPGEKRAFVVKYPADHPRSEFAGKELSYSVEVKGLKEKILPALTDDFAKESAGQESVAELKKKVAEDLEKYLKQLSRVKLERALLDKLVELNPLEVPGGVVKRHSRELAGDALRRMGVKEPKPENLDAISGQFAERAEKEVKAGFLVQAIIEKESVKLSPEEEELKLKELSAAYRTDAAKLKDQLGEDAWSRLRASWLEAKALDFLLSQSKIVDKKVSAEEIHQHGQEEKE